MIQAKPTIIELDMGELDEVLRRAASKLDAEDYALLKTLAEAYTGVERIEVRHSSLRAGDSCPHCENGTVYGTGRPRVLLRLVGQAPVGARVYYLEKLRCNLCGVVFTAEPPAGAGDENHDATVGSMIALLKYGEGIPFHRAEKLQESLGIPLPASTQWDIVEAQAERAEPVFEELIRQAAQGDVVHNDDTTIAGPPLADADDLASVPEPSTLVLVCAGAAAALARAWRRPRR